MLELVDWTKESLKSQSFHPLTVIGNFIVEFLQIHPFQDGNGRISRILTNLLLLKEGYLYIPYVSHEKIVEDNKPDYYLALRKTQKTFKTEKENILPWLDFFFEVLLTQSNQAINLLSEDNIEVILSKKQLEVLRFIQKQEEITPLMIETKLRIPRPTINQILTKLLNLKKIKRIGMGRATRYEVKK